MSGFSMNFSVSAALRDAFGAFREREHACLGVVIENETLVPAPWTVTSAGDLAADAAALQGTLPKDDASFVFLKTSKGIVFIEHIPDTLKPKQKMMFASSAAHVRRESGLSVAGEVHASSGGVTVDDITAATTKPDNMELENEQERTKRTEQPNAGSPEKAELIRGVAFPMAQAAQDAVAAMRDGGAIAVSLRIKNETIELEEKFSAPATLKDALEALPQNEPRFLLAVTENNGSPLNVLAYVCPLSSPVKQRMHYASSKAAVVSYASELCKFNVDKSVEGDCPGDILDAVQPATSDSTASPASSPTAPVAARPKRPGRGGARLITE